MCVTIISLALQHDGRFIPAAARHIASLSATCHLGEVFLSAEQDLDILMQTSTTIKAGINDDALPVVIFT